MELPFREILVVLEVECHFHHFPLISSSNNSRRRLFEDCCRCRLKMPFGRRPSLVDRRRCHHRHYNSSSPLIQRQTMAAEVQLQQQR